MNKGAAPASLSVRRGLDGTRWRQSGGSCSCRSLSRHRRTRRRGHLAGHSDEAAGERGAIIAWKYKTGRQDKGYNALLGDNSTTSPMQLKWNRRPIPPCKNRVRAVRARVDKLVSARIGPICQCLKHLHVRLPREQRQRWHSHDRPTGVKRWHLQGLWQL